MLAAGAPGIAQRSALERLCGTYWAPLYAYARRAGRARADAEDLVQGFFARLLAKGDIAGADPARGPFRAYLLGAFQHYAANQRALERTQRRGGGVEHVRFDFAGAESAIGARPRDDETPERAYERAWARSLVDAARARLCDECAAAGQGALFEALAPLLRGDAAAARAAAEIAERLGKSEVAVRVALHRLRRRFGALLRAAVAETLEDGEDPELEIRRLLTGA